MAEMILTCSVCGKNVESRPILGGMWHTDGTMMCVDETVQAHRERKLHWSDILSEEQKARFTNDWGFRPEDVELRR